MRQWAARAVAWLAAHSVEAVFTLLVIAAFAYTVRISRDFFFLFDDWNVIRQAGSVSHLLDPYNNSLSLVSLVNDRVLVETFGFDYTPFRVIGLLGLVAVPYGYFLTTRRQLGAFLAAMLALPLLWYGRYVSLFPGELNHNLALLGAIGCAAALNRGRRADWVIVAALALALCSAGGGVAVVAACLVHNLCTRAPLRRWLAVLGPAVLYLVWWLIAVGETVDLGPYAMTTSQTLTFVRDLSYATFESAALGSTVVAGLLVAAFAACGIWALSKGLKNGANFVAWSTALMVWAVGLANSRGLLAGPTVFRYRYTALGLVLLAVVPQRPIVWPARFPIATDRRWCLAAASVVLVLGCARGLAVRSDLQAQATLLTQYGRVTRAEALVVGLGPAVVPDDAALPIRLGSLPAGELRDLFAVYGSPFPGSRATADSRLVGLGIVDSRADGARDAPCRSLREPFVYQAAELGSLSLWSPDAPFTVDVRRFGRDWVRLATARPGMTETVRLPGLNAAAPWEVRADGACVVGPPAR